MTHVGAHGCFPASPGNLGKPPAGAGQRTAREFNPTHLLNPRAWRSRSLKDWGCGCWVRCLCWPTDLQVCRAARLICHSISQLARCRRHPRCARDVHPSDQRHGHTILLCLPPSWLALGPADYAVHLWFVQCRRQAPPCGRHSRLPFCAGRSPVGRFRRHATTCPCLPPPSRTSAQQPANAAHHPAHCHVPSPQLPFIM